jgi:hypothetical protein
MHQAHLDQEIEAAIDARRGDGGVLMGLVVEL